MDEVPALVRAHPITPSGHRRTVQAGHENPIEVRVCRAALESGTGREIIGRNRIALIVPQRRRRGAVAAPALTVTLKTFQRLLVEFLASLLRFGGVR